MHTSAESLQSFTRSEIMRDSAANMEMQIREVTGCPVVPLFPFWGGLGSLINPFKQKGGTLLKPWLLGSLGHLGADEQDPRSLPG